MPNVNISTIVAKSPVEIYRILKEIDKFPQFMKDAKEVKVLHRISDDKIVTRWKTDIDGTPVDWLEVDTYNDKEKSLVFKMLEGDFEKYEGRWTLTTLERGTKITLCTYLKWGIPNFERYIGHILENKAYRSLKSMLWLVRKRAMREENG